MHLSRSIVLAYKLRKYSRKKIFRKEKNSTTQPGFQPSTHGFTAVGHFTASAMLGFTLTTM